MIIELYGLTRSGKTFVAERLRKNGATVIQFDSRIIKYCYALFFLFSNFKKSIHLFILLNRNPVLTKSLRFSKKIKLILTRNILLLSTMATYKKASFAKGKVIIDEGFFQIIHTSYEREKTTHEIEKIISLLPKPDMLIILNTKRDIRLKRFKTSGAPREKEFGSKYFETWHASMEHNDKHIRKVLENKKFNFKVHNINNQKNIDSTMSFF